MTENSKIAVSVHCVIGLQIWLKQRRIVWRDFRRLDRVSMHCNITATFLFWKQNSTCTLSQTSLAGKEDCLVICPMRQQHWTDYKISLCVCQSVSEWVSGWVNFGTPSISRERLKLETPNLAHRLATGGRVLTKLCKIRSKGVMKGSRDLLLEF